MKFDPHQLTAAESLVAAYVVEGLSNKEIASVLNKSEPTVKNQVASILRKQGVPSRCRFIVQYLRRGVSSETRLAARPFMGEAQGACSDSAPARSHLELAK